jgi:photosystem II PsbY protein
MLKSDYKNLIINTGAIKIMDLDWRVVIVLAPLGIAAGWAIFNIGAAAIGQFQRFLNKEG